MKDKSTNERNHRQSLLESILPITLGGSLALFHSVETYNLMNRAGMYKINENGVYEHLLTLEATRYNGAFTLGTLALFIVGLYAGGKIAQFIENRTSR